MKISWLTALLLDWWLAKWQTQWRIGKSFWLFSKSNDEKDHLSLMIAWYTSLLLAAESIQPRLIQFFSVDLKAINDWL